MSWRRATGQQSSAKRRQNLSEGSEATQRATSTQTKFCLNMLTGRVKEKLILVIRLNNLHIEHGHTLNVLLGILLVLQGSSVQTQPSLPATIVIGIPVRKGTRSKTPPSSPVRAALVLVQLTQTSTVAWLRDRRLSALLTWTFRSKAESGEQYKLG